MRMPPLPADSIHARACKLKCEKILTRPKNLDTTFSGNIILSVKFGIFYKKTRKSSVISDDFLFRLFIAFFIFHAFSVFFSAIGT